MEDLDEEDEVEEVFFKTPYQAPNPNTWWREMEERRREKSLGFGCAGMSGMNSFEFISIPYKLIFAQSPPFTSTIYILSKMEGHLIQFKSNVIVSTTKVNVLHEIRLLVSRVTVFDEIQGNLYLRKNSCTTWFKSRINSNHSITFIIISLSSN